jgi:hypothetical protein
MPGILDLSRSDPGGILPDWLPRGPRTPAHDLVALGWRGLQALAPNITNSATYAPLPPPAWTPTPEGKLPSSDRDPRVEGVMADLLNLGLMLAPMPGAGPAMGAAPWLSGPMRRSAPIGDLLASKSATLYNSPVKSPRPFSADYPQGATADATRRLLADIEGRPLVAERVVGRRTLGGADEALPSAELDALTQAVVGKNAESVPASALRRGTVGAYVSERGPDGVDRAVLVHRGLPAEAKDRVVAHEVSHAINDRAGDFVGLTRPNMIPIRPGMSRELGTVYNDLNNQYLAAARATNPDVDPAKVYWGTGVTPEKTFGYGKADAPAELMAEAIRAYLADPNYLKTVAPKTAAAVREAVNSHPILSKIIQFNTMVGPAAMIGIEPESSPFSDPSTPGPAP